MRETIGVYVLCLGLVGCTVRATEPVDAGPTPPQNDAAPLDASMRDATPSDAPLVFDPDAACAHSHAEVTVERQPVDIIWMIDNSSSMEPAIRQVREGMNDFANAILDSGLDYRVILLSLRGDTPRDGRYPICIPEPLAGANCSDGERFIHVNVDIRSTQPIEQFLGTLAQSEGYTETVMGNPNVVGSAPWRDHLRDEATKTIVVVTDDNARTCDDPPAGSSCQDGEPRLTALSLEDFAGGGNPFNSRTIGPGILTDTYGTLFEGYTFNGLYGWGSETDPDAPCTFPDDTSPSSAGPTYTALYERTGGVRAQICDGADAWAPFFNTLARSVVDTSRIECDLPLPMPPDGSTLDPRLVNVSVEGSSGTTTIPFAGDEAHCDPTRGGWHYDDASNPTRVILCPASCEFARVETREDGGGLDVLFGCESLLI